MNSLKKQTRVMYRMQWKEILLGASPTALITTFQDKYPKPCELMIWSMAVVFMAYALTLLSRFIRREYKGWKDVL
jgi:hypothetical protein